MQRNPFEPYVEYENDPEGLIIPYKWATKTDREILEAKYQRLVKSSYGYIVRLGIIVR